MTRPLTPSLLAILFVSSASTALADGDEVVQPQSTKALPQTTQTLFFYLQGNPAGLAFTYDLSHPITRDLSLGVNYAWYVYTAGAELSLRYSYFGGLLNLLAGAGVEGGFYQQLQPNEPLPTTFEQIGARSLGMKEFIRAEATLELQLDYIWLHGRLSPTRKWRDFTELDSRRGFAVEDEFSLGDAAAILVRVWGDPKAPELVYGDRAEGWIYAEYTSELVRGYQGDWLPAAKHTAVQRPSVGVIANAPFGRSGVTIDLDIYYSLLDGALIPNDPHTELDGVGAQLFVWWKY